MCKNIISKKVHKKSISIKKELSVYESILFSDHIKILIKDQKEREKIYKIILKKFYKFKICYLNTLDKYSSKKRDSEIDAFSHQKGVLNIYINNFSIIKKEIAKLKNGNEKDIAKGISIINQEIDRAIICIAHDTLEDTDTVFKTMIGEYGAKTALSILIISKPSVKKFIDDKNDLKLYDFLRKKGIINSNGKFTETINKKIYIEESGLSFLESIAENEGNENFSLSKEEKKYIEKYKKVREKYKKARDNYYFNNMSSFKKVEVYANTMNLKHNLKLSKKEIKQSCRNAIMIKVSDRIHNLSDMLQTWEFTPEKIDKKIIETEKFLLKIAKEIGERFYLELSKELELVKKGIEK